MNMETKEEKEQISGDQRTLKLYIFNKLYEALSKGEFLNDAYILYDHIKTPLKDDIEYKKMLYKKALSLPEEYMENKTRLGKILDDDPNDQFNKHCKAVFVNEYFKTFTAYLSQNQFLDYFETVIK